MKSSQIRNIKNIIVFKEQESLSDQFSKQQKISK